MRHRRLHLLLLCGLLAFASGSSQGGARVVDVREAGAVGDGLADETAAFRAALAGLVDGGGTLRVPAGRYLIAPIRLSSGVTLHLEADAVLVGSTVLADYPIEPARWEGTTQPAHAPLVGASDAESVAITGDGTIDGRGAVWWRAHEEGTLSHPRPRLVEFTRVRGLRIEGVTLLDSPSWTVHPVDCEDVRIQGVTIRAPRDSPNTDGIDPDSSKRVHISDCDIDVGDDAIVLKSGKRPTAGAPTEDVTIEDCRLRSGHGALAIGSEMSGGVFRVQARRVRIDDSWIGIRLKTNRTRGGSIEDVLFEDITLTKVERPIVVNPFYGEDDDEEPGSEPAGPGTPRIAGLTLRRIQASGAVRGAKIVGLPEAPLRGLTIEDVRLDAERGVEIRDAESPAVSALEVAVEKGPALRLVRILGGSFSGFAARGGRRKDPIASIEHVVGLRTGPVDLQDWIGRRDAVRVGRTSLEAWPHR